MNQELTTQSQVTHVPAGNDTEVLVTQDYAGFWIRFAAALIDGLALQAVMWVIRLVAGVDLLHPPFWLTLIGYAISWSYATILTVKFGQTLGKMIVGVRVVRQDGRPLGWGQVLLRETLGKIVSALLLLIGYIMAGFDSKKRALHDRMASTYVIKVKSK
jgi:uncharacterized RDD family membrane protein YckC